MATVKTINSLTEVTSTVTGDEFLLLYNSGTVTHNKVKINNIAYKEVKLSFSDNINTITYIPFKGHLGNFISSDVYNEIQTVTYQSRIDTSSTWTIHADIEAVRAYSVSNYGSSKWVLQVSVIYKTASNGISFIIIKYK